MTLADGIAPVPREVDGLRRLGITVVALAVVVVALAAAYLAGRHAGTGSRADTLTGRAYVGDDEASARVGGWSYGFVPSTVTWYDAAGSSYDGTIAPCLRKVGTYARIRFGYVTAPLPDGGASRVVTWVRCLP